MESTSQSSVLRVQSNHNRYHSIMFQVVDSRAIFLHFLWGYLADAKMFRGYFLFRRMETSFEAPNVSEDIKIVSIPPLIIEDAAYSLHPCLMRPYFTSTTLEHKCFKCILSFCRMSMENAYGNFQQLRVEVTGVSKKKRHF